MVRITWERLLISLLLIVQLFVSTFTAYAAPAASGPSIGGITTNFSDYGGEDIPQYAKFEVGFDITNTTASNPYFPHDPAPPSGVEAGTGISVDIITRAPGASDWRNSPCFFYQPVTEVGDALLPTGDADWRCRLAPDTVGTWQYKVRATDAGGTTESAVHEFTCAPSDRKGFVRVSETDPRFFEFSDGTPFVTPLINVEEGNPFNTLTEIRQNVRALGEHGIRFVRWLPTGEGANYFVAPFADSIRVNWRFGDSVVTTNDVDVDAGKQFSFRPYYYAIQQIPLIPGERYRLRFSARAVGERVVRAQIGTLTTFDICSSTSTLHEANGETCDVRQDGWHDYVVEVENLGATSASVGLRGLYVSSDAPSPFNISVDERLRTHSLTMERQEADGTWSGNLLTRSDPDTHTYVDQRAAARLDEILRLSEQYGVYHKLTLFHKNDAVLARFQADGAVGEWDPHNFYTSPASRWYQDAYVRYFIARWAYSPALHSLELANENHLWQESQDAAFDVAALIRDLEPRPVLLSNSFWGWWVQDFWTDPARGHLMDYADKHWYANEGGSYCNDQGTDCELISNVWDDSAAYVRECRERFREYAANYDYDKPIVRGEGGVAVDSTEPQHPAVATDPAGTYYHKKLWAHVGVLGASCDGEWYPRLFLSESDGAFPNAERNLPAMFAAYERFVDGEPLNNGRYVEIGTDLTGNAGIALRNVSGQPRAWGVRDSAAGRALLWLDNAAHTWTAVVNGAPIAPASATLTVPGFTSGHAYVVRWWDPYAGPDESPTLTTERVTADGNGALTLTVSGLDRDLAVKIRSDVATNLPHQIYLPLTVSGG